MTSEEARSTFESWRINGTLVLCTSEFPLWGLAMMGLVESTVPNLVIKSRSGEATFSMAFEDLLFAYVVKGERSGIVARLPERLRGTRKDEWLFCELIGNERT